MDRDTIHNFFVKHVDILLGHKHEKSLVLGTPDECPVTIDGITICMHKNEARYLSAPIRTYKAFKDDDTAVIIGDFKQVEMDDGFFFRFLLVAFKNNRGRYQLAIMHDLRLFPDEITWNE
nr:hypothetical protein [Candidatus Sigynarchaeum springense]